MLIIYVFCKKYYKIFFFNKYCKFILVVLMSFGENIVVENICKILKKFFLLSIFIFYYYYYVYIIEFIVYIMIIMK